jgi:hypothetical protein
MQSHRTTQQTGLGATGEQPFVDSGPRSGPADALVLDIGGDIGALIIYADEACLGSEIDLTPVGVLRSHHLHTMVRRRRATNKDIVAGLYPEVPEGTYTVWGLDDSGPIGEVTIMGGHVSEFQAGACRGVEAPGAGQKDSQGDAHGEHHRDGHPHTHEDEHPHVHPRQPHGVR